MRTISSGVQDFWGKFMSVHGGFQAPTAMLVHGDEICEPGVMADICIIHDSQFCSLGKRAFSCMALAVSVASLFQNRSTNVTKAPATRRCDIA